jgi:hypothetical protein
MKNLTKIQMNEVATDLMTINLSQCVTNVELKLECKRLACRIVSAELSLIYGCRSKEAIQRVEKNLERARFGLEKSLKSIGCRAFGDEITEIMNEI